MCSVHINNSLLDNVPSIYLPFHYPRYFSLISHSSWVADINIIASRNFLLAAFGDIFDLKHNSMVIVKNWKWLKAIEGYGRLWKAIEGYWRLYNALECYRRLLKANSSCIRLLSCKSQLKKFFHFLGWTYFKYRCSNVVYFICVCSTTSAFLKADKSVLKSSTKHINNSMVWSNCWVSSKGQLWICLMICSCLNSTSLAVSLTLSLAVQPGANMSW